MRVGHNPQKDLPLQGLDFDHLVIIPLYIPDFEGYFADSLTIFDRSLNSIIETSHQRTMIAVINNGSCAEVVQHLQYLLEHHKIHELIHTQNIGKVNAILKGLAGNNIPVVTITDADVLFLPGWQNETISIFNHWPKVGIVGLVPQFKMYEAHCGNIIADHLFSKNLRYTAVKDPDALVSFYDSIGWKRNYNPDYLKYALTLNSGDKSVYAGNGHVVATYRKDIFTEILSWQGFRLGGDSEQYLDRAALRKGYWKVTTYNNYACHMGNVMEDWIREYKPQPMKSEPLSYQPVARHKVSGWSFVFKNKALVKIFSIRFLYLIFMKVKGLPAESAKKY